MRSSYKALFLAMGCTVTASQGLEAGLRTKTKELGELVHAKASERKAQVSASATALKSTLKVKKDKIKETFKETGKEAAKNTLEGAQKVVTAVRGTESAHVTALQAKLDTTAETLIKLDNVVSLEVILKMIQLFQADVSFQFEKKRQGFDRIRGQLDALLTKTQRDMDALRNNAVQKQKSNIDRLQQAISGRAALARQAQQALEDDNTVLLGVIDGLNNYSDNALGFVRTLVARAAATKKETAQKDLEALNRDLEAAQTKLTTERAKLETALKNPKFQSRMADLMAQQSQIIAAIAQVSDAYTTMMENDFFNYFDPSATAYLRDLGVFSDGSGCHLSLANYRKDAIQSCKARLITQLKDNDIEKHTACTSLTPDADIVDVQDCITSVANVPLTTFGRVLVAQ